jgi:hypothetical protein
MVPSSLWTDSNRSGGARPEWRPPCRRIYRRGRRRQGSPVAFVVPQCVQLCLKLGPSRSRHGALECVSIVSHRIPRLPRWRLTGALAPRQWAYTNALRPVIAGQRVHFAYALVPVERLRDRRSGPHAGRRGGALSRRRHSAGLFRCTKRKRWLQRAVAPARQQHVSRQASELPCSQGRRLRLAHMSTGGFRAGRSIDSVCSTTMFR